jgi:hypothetical protein
MKKFFPQKYLYNLAHQVPRRIRFVISSIILTVLVLLTTFFEFQFVWIFVPVLIIATCIFTYFAVLDGISKNEVLLLFIVPVSFTVAAYLFYFLFPVRWLTRVPLILVYGMSIYAILLTSNIFNVGVEKNIQLYRAAFSVNYLFQTLVIFLSTEVILSFRLPFFVNAGLLFILLYGLSIQLLWSVSPQPVLERKVLFNGFILTFLIVQIAVAFSFIPLRSTIYSLLITASYYSLGGLFYHYLDNKLFKTTIREYVFVSMFVLIIVILTIPW